MQNYLLRLAWLKFAKILVKIFTKNQQGSSVSHKKKKEKRMEREFCLNHRGYHIRIENNLSIDEINKLTSDVEIIVNEHTGIKNYFLQTGQFSNVVAGGGGSSEDLIATAYFEFVDRNQRKNGHGLHKILSKLMDIKLNVA